MWITDKYLMEKKNLCHLAKKELEIKTKVFGKLMILTVYKSMREMGDLIAVENEIWKDFLDHHLVAGLMTVLRIYLKSINKDGLNNLAIDMAKCGIIIKVRNHGEMSRKRRTSSMIHKFWWFQMKE